MVNQRLIAYLLITGLWVVVESGLHAVSRTKIVITRLQMEMMTTTYFIITVFTGQFSNLHRCKQLCRYSRRGYMLAGRPYNCWEVPSPYANNNFSLSNHIKLTISLRL
mmetsp:Transcript_41090/g.66085  ORF Transcript_41090/g.66085 Transcript_41090/m.66085 type:complete len:108 (+) Transcript_41090:91-414(+)